MTEKSVFDGVHPEVEEKRCRKCKLVWPIWAYRRTDGGRGSCPERATCRYCEITARNKVDPFRRKALDTRRRHAKKYGFSVTDFAEKYGWDIERLIHLIRHAYENTCGYCGRTFKEMSNRLSDLTIDIRDIDKAPYLNGNVAMCCGTCNSAKGTMSAALFAEWLMGWKKYENRGDEELPRVALSQVDIFGGLPCSP